MSKLAWGMGLSVGVHALVLSGLLLETSAQKPPVLHEHSLVLSLQHIVALPVQETPSLAVEPPKASPPPPKQPPLANPTPPKEKPKAKPKKPAPSVEKPLPKTPSWEAMAANETLQEPVQETPVGARIPNTLLAASSQTASAHVPASLPAQAGAQAWEEEAYLQRLQAVILQHKSYPTRARKMKLQGEVIVTFEITPQGEVLNLSVVQSSSHAFLDQHTLKTIQEASTSFPKPPVRITVKVPVGYRLL